MEVKAPPAEWDSPLAVFEATLEHEQKVTGLINDLVDIALEQRDHATQFFFCSGLFPSRLKKKKVSAAF